MKQSGRRARVACKPTPANQILFHYWVAVKELTLSYHNGYIFNTNMVAPI